MDLPPMESAPHVESAQEGRPCDLGRDCKGAPYASGMTLFTGRNASRPIQEEAPAGNHQILRMLLREP
eukprot:6900313-Heterocapsa_arctica.AAC.1